jgi:hypothetical protein
VKVVFALVTLAIVLVFVGGVGFIACRIAEAETARIVFMAILVGGVAVTGAALLVALVVGFYHLYLFLFTDRRPLSLFATTSKDDE